jgi:hypothetical protein
MAIKPTSARGILKAAGLTVVTERDATIGHEYLLQDTSGKTVSSGWVRGTKVDALECALSDAREKGLVTL